MRFFPFRMERWQSQHEHRVRFNLSDSGVHPLTLSELLALAGGDHAEDELRALRLGYPQTNGTSTLRQRVAALHRGVDESAVLITSGGAEANFLALWRLLEPGAGVAALLPSYLQVPGLVRSLGGRLLPVRLRERADWAPDLTGLGEALRGGARVVLVTNPNNPTGAILTEEAMDAIVAEARAHDAWILADEVYRGAELDGEETPSFIGRYTRVVATGSLSKAYGLPGLRLGWIVAPPPVVEDLWARKDYTTIAPTAISEPLAALALAPESRHRILERTRNILRSNLPILQEWAEGADGVAHLHTPKAGAIALLGYRGDLPSEELADRIRTRRDVLVVPGAHFGAEGWLRVGYGEPATVLQEALGRVGEELAAS